MTRRARGGACFCAYRRQYSDPDKRKAMLETARKWRIVAKAHWPEKEPRQPRPVNPDRRVSQPVYRMLQSAAKNAKRRGVAINLCAADLEPLPLRCPILGLALDYGYRTKGGRWQLNSPSVDRIDPSRGYVRGNVQILSMRANMLKSNATTEELRKVADYMDLYA